MPLISVIVPVYKVEQYLSKCIDSILSQSFQDFEIILVDDGSPDRCGQICEQYSANNANIIVIHQKNAGLSAARNAGIQWAIEHSNSEWLAFVDSDDYISPYFLEKLYKESVKNSSDICMCDFLRIYENSGKVEESHEFPKGVYSQPEDFFNILYLNWRTIMAWNKLYRKDLFLNIRYDVGKTHEDEFIIHKLLGASKRICYIEDQLYFYIIRDNSIMTSENTIVNKIIAWEAWIQRYWYCKKHNYPINLRIITIEYMMAIASVKKDVPANYRQQYRWVKKEFRKMYLNERGDSIKSRVFTLIYPFYRNFIGK